MKKNTAILLIAIFLISNSWVSFGSAAKNDVVLKDKEFRALWVATVVNLDYPVKGTTDAATLKNEALVIIKKAQEMGFNSIILQVRPTADAFYKSNLFPWSKYLTGKQGTAPTLEFDPLKFWVDETHARGMELHAWVNPYRITRKLASESAHDFASLTQTHPANMNPSWVVKHTDGNLYFDPGIPEVMTFIVKGVEEIAKNYDVDGIHFDDYFYPDTQFDDGKTFTKYGAGYKSKDDWRRNNVNTLIDMTYSAIKKIDKNIVFGISPFGIWANKGNNALGSDTNGLESYYAHYADTRKWVIENKLDYIAPQIYWNIGHSKADYSKLVKWWSDVAKNSTVKLYVGHAAYNAGNKDQSSPWYGIDEIRRQLDLNKTYPEVDGSIFFRYGSFASNVNLTQFIQNYYTGETTNAYTLAIARPSSDLTTSAKEYFIGGVSDSASPLYLNGVEVKNRTSSGFFGIFVPLKEGTNTFTFEQKGVKAVRTIIRGQDPIVLAPPMTDVRIVDGTTLPKTNAIYMPGETIQFSCQAPIGSTVKVTFADKEIVLTPKTTVTLSPKPYATTFTGQYVIPTTITSPILKWGNPVYSMVYKGKSDSRVAQGSLQIVTAQSPLTATVVVPYADSYITASASEGAHYMLNRGMTDRVIGKTNDFIKLASGIWVKETSVTIKETALSKTIVSQAVHEVSKAKESVHFITAQRPVVSAEYSEGVVSIKLSNVDVLPTLVLKNSKLFSTVTSKKEGIYQLKVSDGAQIAGFVVENTDVGYRVDFKYKFKSQNPTKPLSGATILLDPGHGGTDTGALGLLGTLYPEKRITFELASLLRDELINLGAKVEMTRTSDVTVSLQDRLLMSRKLNPDLYLSIHVDSAGETLDLSKVNGFSVFYKEVIAQSIAQTIKDTTINEHSRKDRGVKTANFYVVRGTWTPSILLESGFMPNPLEFEWLIRPDSQKNLAKTWASAIVKHFK